jgi:hypothetical protein
MNKWLEILLGLILFIAPIVIWVYNWYGFGESAGAFLKGGLVWLVLIIGFMFIMLGISDLKEN